MASTLLSNISQVMNERSSVRYYKKNVKIPADTLLGILELAGKAPSGWNLQHWKFVVIQEVENKQRMLPIAYNQQQVVDCSALIVVLGDLEANRNAEEVYTGAVNAGYMTEVAKAALINQIHSTYRTDENIAVNDATVNASLASMQLMLAAKTYGVDSCSIGGFKPKELRQELKVPDRYKPIMLITLGYAKKFAHKTLRFPVKDIMIEESF